MKVQSKCWNCAQWTENSGKIEERCSHCGEMLHKEQFESKNKALTNRLIEKQSNVLTINDNDNLLVRFLKKTGLVFQFIFVSFASFVLWLVTLLTG